MTAVKKTAPGPMLSAGWQDGDPAPGDAGANPRHRFALQAETLPATSAECSDTCPNFHENDASSAERGSGRSWQTALGHANVVRLARAEVRRDVVAGRIQLSDLVLAAPEMKALQNAIIYDVLMWKPRVGHTRARKILQGVVSEARTFAEFARFSERTRTELLDRLLAMEDGR